MEFSELDYPEVLSDMVAPGERSKKRKHIYSFGYSNSEYFPSLKVVFDKP